MQADPSFRMKAEDVFGIAGRGTIITGQVESGTVSVGDMIYIKGQGSRLRAVVTDIEMLRKSTKQAHAGDIVGLLLRGERGIVQCGDILMGSDPGFS